MTNPNKGVRARTRRRALMASEMRRAGMSWRALGRYFKVDFHNLKRSIKHHTVENGEIHSRQGAINAPETKGRKAYRHVARLFEP